MMNGYKTYIVAIAMAAVAVVEGLLGIDIPGADVQADWFNQLLLAFGLGALRMGVAGK